MVTDLRLGHDSNALAEIVLIPSGIDKVSSVLEPEKAPAPTETTLYPPRVVGITRSFGSPAKPVIVPEDLSKKNRTFPTLYTGILGAAKAHTCVSIRIISNIEIALIFFN